MKEWGDWMRKKGININTCDSSTVVYPECYGSHCASQLLEILWQRSTSNSPVFPFDKEE